MTDSPLVRWAVAVQRRSAVAATITAATLILLALATAWFRSGGLLITCLVFATCASTAVAEVGARATSLWDRLCFTGIGVGATYPVAYVFGSDEWTILAVAAAAVAVPHVTVHFVNRAPAFATRAALALFVALAAGLPALAPHLGTLGEDALIALVVAWLLTLPVAFHAAMAVRAHDPRLPLHAAVVGAVSGAVLSQAAGHRSAGGVLAFAAAWFLAAALVAFASVGRSLTAAPLDHPIYADFGGRAERAPA